MKKALVLAAFCCSAGCGKSESGPAPTPTPIPSPTPVPAPTPAIGSYQVAPVENSGSLSVMVRYLGRPPRNRPVDDPQCHGGKADDVVVGPEKQLRDAVAHLEIGAGKDFPSGPPPVINQVSCMFVPHVVLCKTNEAVTFRSSDEPLHNIHVLAYANHEMNQSVQRGGSVVYTPRSPEFIRVKCDVHPWMSAYIVVQKHPYYAISDAGGVAELAEIPAGKFKLKVWHGTLGELSREVEIKPNEKTEIVIEFPAE